MSLLFFNCLTIDDFFYLIFCKFNAFFNDVKVFLYFREIFFEKV